MDVVPRAVDAARDADTGGVTQEEVEEAFPRWQLLSVGAASTASLGWPLSGTSPQCYRLRLGPD